MEILWMASMMLMVTISITGLPILLFVGYTKRDWPICIIASLSLFMIVAALIMGIFGVTIQVIPTEVYWFVFLLVNIALLIRGWMQKIKAIIFLESVLCILIFAQVVLYYIM